MENTEFLGVEITFEIPVTDEMRLALDLGLVTLQKDGRRYVLDAVKSWIGEDPFVLHVQLEVYDDEGWVMSEYDLTETDLWLGKLDGATFYIGDEDHREDPQHMTLFIKDKTTGTTKAIELLED
jgi:hypothetical protein